MKTSDPWLLLPYTDIGSYIFVVLMTHIMTVRESFYNQHGNTNNTKNITQTSQDIDNQTHNNIIQNTRVYSWSLKV